MKRKRSNRSGHIRKKGNRWYPTIHLGKNRYKSLGGYRTKTEADVILDEVLNSMHNGTYRELIPITFKEYADQWLDGYGKDNLRWSTRKGYADILRHYWGIFDNRKLVTIAPIEIEQKMAELREKGLRLKTRKNILMPLKLALKQAVKKGYLKVNPVDGVETPKKESDISLELEKQQMEFIDGYDNLKKYLESIPENKRLYFELAIDTGMREGELSGSKWTDIDFKTNQIFVQRQYYKGYINPPKTKASIRYVDIPPEMALKLKKLFLESPNKDGFIFANGEGRPLNPSSLIRRYHYPALAKAGLKKMRFHCLRDTNVALRADNGQSIEHIAKQLGHSDINTTWKIYFHFFNSTERREAKKFRSVLAYTLQ